MVSSIERKGEFVVIFEEAPYAPNIIYEDWINLHQIVSVKFLNEFKPIHPETIYCTEIIMTNGTNKNYQFPKSLYEQFQSILNLYHRNGKSFF